MSKVILFRGKPGSGKTTLSKRVGKKLGFCVLARDDIYEPLFDHISDHDEIVHSSYAILKNMVLSFIKSGSDLIVENTLHYERDYLDFKNFVEENGGELISVLCYCSDEEVWRKRIDERENSPKINHVVKTFDELKKRYGGSMDTKSFEGELVLDTLVGVDEGVKKVMEFLEGKV